MRQKGDHGRKTNKIKKHSAIALVSQLNCVYLLADEAMTVEEETEKTRVISIVVEISWQLRGTFVVS